MIRIRINTDFHTNQRHIVYWSAWLTAGCSGKGIPCWIMEPVKGGMLANPPKTVLDVLKGAEPDSSAASWALRFAAGLDGVLTVLSGMSNEEQMRDNISCMKGFSSLDEKERLALSRAQEEIKKVPLIPCTTCNYCAKVCPQNIGISGTFTADNYFTLYGNRDMALSQADWLVDRHGRQRADKCVGCGNCEKVCPQHIEIRKELKKSVKELY